MIRAEVGREGGSGGLITVTSSSKSALNAQRRESWKLKHCPLETRIMYAVIASIKRSEFTGPILGYWEGLNYIAQIKPHSEGKW